MSFTNTFYSQRRSLYVHLFTSDPYHYLCPVRALPARRCFRDSRRGSRYLGRWVFYSQLRTLVPATVLPTALSRLSRATASARVPLATLRLEPPSRLSGSSAHSARRSVPWRSRAFLPCRPSVLVRFGPVILLGCLLSSHGSGCLASGATLSFLPESPPFRSVPIRSFLSVVAFGCSSWLCGSIFFRPRTSRLARSPGLPIGFSPKRVFCSVIVSRCLTRWSLSGWIVGWAFGARAPRCPLFLLLLDCLPLYLILSGLGRFFIPNHYFSTHTPFIYILLLTRGSRISLRVRSHTVRPSSSVGRNYAVEDEPCNSVTDLIDLLTDAFGTAKNLDQYRGELSIIYLKPGEHILDYISRVKDLRTAILDAERREHGELDSYFVAEIDNLTTRSFYEGLPLDYRLQVSPLTYPRHTDMFAAAKAIAKRQELGRQRLETRPRQRKGPIGKPLAHSTPHKSNHLDRYNYPRETVGRRDYSYDVRNRELPQNTPRNYYPPRYEPRRDVPRTNNYTERFDRNRDNTRNEFNRGNDRRTNDRAEQPVCKYCKNFGHTVDECRKRQYNNPQHERSGNLSGPSGHRSQNPTDEKRNTRPIRIVETEEKETERPTEPESQS
ncbi:hypothetical protein ALC60_12438 [Trachymyrmex zeteki]|uniref:CCHC-type domain-containing protein n=1 Tax=Mycetomoellerius zeteki TaxID=64791 RepID=A0A151WKZ6_9HYME|nr:hypothetical protein ALC60_12438 [Trachymyrmex zeteki]